MKTYTAVELASMSDDELRRVIAAMNGYTNLRYSAQSGLMYGITPELNELRPVPEWTTDTNPAMCLLEGTECIVRWSRIYEAWRAGFSDWEDQEFVVNPSAARAICEAWVLMKGNHNA